MICRCVFLILRLLLMLMLVPESNPSPDYVRCWILDARCRLRPTTAATMIGVPARAICWFGQVFFRAVSYNRNHSRPKARSRFRDDNCGANARPLPTRDQNIFPNRGVLLPGADHKNKFPPNA